jgi:hypothetical protein
LCCANWGPHRSNNSNTILVTTTNDFDQSQWTSQSHFGSVHNIIHNNHHKKRTLVCIPGSSSQSSAHSKKSNNKKIKSFNKPEEIQICSIERLNDCSVASDQSCDINSITCKNHSIKNKKDLDCMESSL